MNNSWKFCFRLIGDARRSKQFIVNQNSQQNVPAVASPQTKKPEFQASPTTARVIQPSFSTTRAPVPKVFTTSLKKVDRPVTHFTTTENSIRSSEKAANCK